MFETRDGTPTELASLHASQHRFCDGLAADGLLIQIERAGRAPRRRRAAAEPAGRA